MTTAAAVAMACLAGILAAAGAAKLLRPGPAARALHALGLPRRARLLASLELAAAALALAAPARIAAPAAAALFGAFAFAGARLARAGEGWDSRSAGHDG